jgi:hypothetical protein
MNFSLPTSNASLTHAQARRNAFNKSTRSQRSDLPVMALFCTLKASKVGLFTSLIMKSSFQGYGFCPPIIQHVCDNKSAISATWKDENISVFYKTKPDADVAKVARLAISDIQKHSQVHAFWVEGHVDKRGPPFSPQE